MSNEKPILTGIVKMFNPTRGFGFISVGNGTPDVYVHYTAIQCQVGRVRPTTDSVRSQGFRSLEKGQRVRFTVKRTDRGIAAEEVWIDD